MKVGWNASRRQFLRTVGIAASGSVFFGCSIPVATPTTRFVRKALGPDDVETLGYGVIAPEGPAVLPNGDVAMVEFSEGNVVVLDKSGNKRILAHVGIGVAGTILGDDGALYVAKSDVGAFMRSMPPPSPGEAGSPPGAGPGEGPGNAPPGDPPGGAMPNDGTPSGIWRIDLQTEQAVVLYDKENGEALAGPNDLVKDNWGDLWVSQPAGASVLNLRTDGSHVATVLTGVSGVNGITMSPDKKVLYVMSGNRLMAYQVAARGRLEGDAGAPVGRVVLDWPAELPTPDGMKTQADGNVLCACRDDGVVEVSPQGELISQTVVEGQQVINMTFSPFESGTLLLAVHPADSMTGGLARIAWPSAGVL